MYALLQGDGNHCSPKGERNLVQSLQSGYKRCQDLFRTTPTKCRCFFCLWLVNPELGPEWKPDLFKDGNHCVITEGVNFWNSDATPATRTRGEDKFGNFTRRFKSGLWRQDFARWQHYYCFPWVNN